MDKKLLVSGGFAPPRAVPLDPAGDPDSAPDPRFGLALRALAMVPPLANSGSATDPQILFTKL